MKTTVHLDNGLMEEVKRYAAERNKTLPAVIEESLRAALARRDAPRRGRPVRLTTFGGSGLLPGIDLDGTSALLDTMDSPHAPA